MTSIQIKQARLARPWRKFSAAAAGLGWLAASLCANAQVSVDTIGGGVRTECGKSSGFVSGNTYDTAQFNGPYSCALDTNGNLWIADRTNACLEQVTQAGNKSSSLTIEYYTTSGTSPHIVTNLHPFTNITGVAVDPGNNLYILMGSPTQIVQVVQSALSAQSTVLNTNYAMFLTGVPSTAFPSAIAVDGGSNVFLAFTNGVLIRFPFSGRFTGNTTNLAYANAQSYMVGGSFRWQPAGLALRADGSLAVSDTLSNAIYVVSTNGFNTNATATNSPQLLTGGNGAGYDEGSPGIAQFDQPRGLAASADGHLIVCDSMNNRVRAVDTNGNTTWLYGTGSNVWPATCCNCDPTLYAGWVDGAAGLASNSAAGRLPVSVAISPAGSLFVTELYYNLIRQVTNTTFTPVNLNGTFAIATIEPAGSISSTNATLNGTVNPGDETTYYYFEYGPTTNYGFFTPTNTLSTGLTTSQQVSAAINFLSPSTTYYFQLVAFNGLGYSYSGQSSLLTLAQAPVVATEQPINVIVNSATLQASVNPEYAPTQVTFQWGTTTNLGNTTPPISLTTNLTSYQTVGYTLNNLQAGTTYYYQAVANSSGGMADGAQIVFSTPAGGVITLAATNITTSGATLQGSVNPGGTPATVYFQWGTNASYGNITASTNLTSNLTTAQTVTAGLSNLQASTTYYYQVVSSNIGGVIFGNATNFTTLATPPPTLSFSPSNGYFPNCVTISVTSSVQTVYYTSDGTTPTTNSAEVLLTVTNANGSYSGSFLWCEPLLNLSSLQLLAANATNAANATLLSGSAPTTNLIGFPQPLSAGPGAHLYIPVVVELQSNTTLESLQFRIELTPVSPNTNIIPPFSLQPLTANDFVPLPGPAPSDAPVSITNYPYTIGSTEGAVITAQGGSGLDMQGSGVVVMLHVQVPNTTVIGQSFLLNVLDASGTSDGQQANVGLATLPPQTLTIAYVPYMVGDSSPSTGYNAGQFGIKGAVGGTIEVGLDNADVNNAIYASAGIRVPPTDSDAFNAMDAYPPDSAGHGGDGVIGFNDWQTILGRSLGLSLYLGMDTNNYLRFWTNGDTTFRSHSVFTNWAAGGPPVLLSLDPLEDPLGFGPTKFSLSNSPPGLVWFCEASIGSGVVTNALPGNTYSLPVYANVLPGYSLAGMQFRAIVTGSSGAPAVTSIQFNPASGMPAPLVLPGLSGNDKVHAWSFGSFARAMENSNYLGTISFEVPPGAYPGVCYALHFSGVDGAPDFSIDYQMESHPGYVWVLSAAQQPVSLTSDEWKLTFFGSLTNSLAGDNVDADGDGALNWQEYLAGTNPTNALSRLQFSSASLYNNGMHGVAINWLTAPGKNYILQTSPAVTSASWTPINTNSGDGNEYQFIVTNMSGNAHFYKILLQP